jgi:hypothetical protein
MKFAIQFVVIFILAYLLELFLPWYTIAIAALIGGLLNSRFNFFAGFLAIALLWTLKAALIESESSSDLANRVALIFPVKQKALLYVVMALIGGLVAGFAAMAGSALRKKKVNNR